MSKVIEKKSPERYQCFSCESSLEKSLLQEAKIVYNLDFSHLTDLSFQNLETWIDSYKYCVENHGLDVLYSLYSEETSFSIMSG